MESNKKYFGILVNNAYVKLSRNEHDYPYIQSQLLITIQENLALYYKIGNGYLSIKGIFFFLVRFYVQK